MKTFLLNKKSAFTALVLGVTMMAQAQNQTTPELEFKQYAIENGGAPGANGTIYRFKNVVTQGQNVDALLTISGRSSSKVTITSIDINNTGWDKALQPQIAYDGGNAPRGTTWWVDFDINFVKKGTNEPLSITNFNLTALDIDGDGQTLNETVAFYNNSTYTLENNSLLGVQSIWATILGLLTPGRQFDGPKTNYTDINTSATQVMTTVGFSNKNSFRMRLGGSTSIAGGSSAADRMYSFWFKGLSYNVPVIITLPVKLTSFTAVLNNNQADLKWVSSSEKDVSHYVVQKSTDGKNFSDAGVVMAAGNSTDNITYTFTDKTIDTDHEGVTYYRLRSVDIDAKSQLSEVRVIRVDKKGSLNLAIQTYPNPVQNELRVTLPSNWQGKKVTYEVLNQNGQVAAKKLATSASQTENFNVSGLPTGFYVVRVTCDGETASQKVIKQ